MEQPSSSASSIDWKAATPALWMKPPLWFPEPRMVPTPSRSAHDFEQARFLGQVMHLHQPRQAFNLAEDIANDRDRIELRLVGDIGDTIKQRLGHLAGLG